MRLVSFTSVRQIQKMLKQVCIINGSYKGINLQIRYWRKGIILKIERKSLINSLRRKVPNGSKKQSAIKKIKSKYQISALTINRSIANKI